jgi:hypothetical protein
VTTALVFDTCSLPQRGALADNPIMSAIMRIAQIKRHQLLVSEVVKTETLGERERAASAALEKLRTGIREVSKVFGSGQVDYYIPSEGEAVKYWRREIDAAFEVISLSGGDAIEAIYREARRIAPARATADGSAVGSRDAAIWLSIKRFHLERPGEETCFISGNTGDFSDVQDKRKLRQELLDELGDAKGRFFYFVSLGSLIEHIAEKAETEAIENAALERLNSEGGMEAALQEALEVMLIPGHGNIRLYSFIAIEAAKEIRAYNVDDTRLSMLDVGFRFISTEVESGTNHNIERPFGGKARMWTYQVEGSLSLELENVTSVEPIESIEDSADSHT